METSGSEEVRALEIDELDRSLPWVITIDSDPAENPYTGSDGIKLPFNRIGIRDPEKIDSVLNLGSPDLIVLNPHTTPRTVSEFVRHAPVVVIIDPSCDRVEQVEEMYREGAVVVLDKASDPRVINAAVNEALKRKAVIQLVKPASGSDTTGEDAAEEENPVVKIGALEVNYDKVEAKFEGIPVDFKRMEWDIFLFLIENKDKLVSQQAIVAAVWGHPIDKHLAGSLKVHIARIRKKVPGFIKTRINRGYIFETPSETQS